MKFKYLSSDFLASYNELIEEIEEKQANLDSMYEEKVEALMTRERARLDMIAPMDFEIGDAVKIVGSKRTGHIISSQLDFDVILRDSLDEWGNPYYGPARFIRIGSAVEEEAATLGGMFRTYTVECVASEIEIDWGQMSITSAYHPDDLEKIELDVQ
jgi:hypothetical protein